MKNVKPSNWPSELKYVNSMTYNKKILPKKDIIHGVKIIKLDDNHLLSGEYGLFASKNWQKYNIIGEYTGEVIIIDGGKYCAYLTDKYCVDASSCGNELRYINDYRNIKNKPNTKLQVVYLDKKPKVLVVVIEDINKNEEILLDYGENYWESFK